MEVEDGKGKIPRCKKLSKKELAKKFTGGEGDWELYMERIRMNTEASVVGKGSWQTEEKIKRTQYRKMKRWKSKCWMKKKYDSWMGNERKEYKTKKPYISFLHGTRKRIEQKSVH